jgi:hypothetical protein
VGERSERGRDAAKGSGVAPEGLCCVAFNMAA